MVPTKHVGFETETHVRADQLMYFIQFRCVHLINSLSSVLHYFSVELIFYFSFDFSIVLETQFQCDFIHKTKLRRENLENIGAHRRGKIVNGGILMSSSTGTDFSGKNLVHLLFTLAQFTLPEVKVICNIS